MKTTTLAAGLLSVGLTNALSLRAAASVSDCLNDKNVPVKWTTSPEYAELAEPFNLRLAYKPKVIVLPETTKHVQDAVTCAAKCNIKVQAKSGGHSYASYSSGGKDGSMMIFLQPMNSISVDSNTHIAKVGGGVRLGNLAQGIYDQGKRALPHGTCPGVGIGGHFTHGGYGHTSRHWGVALDTIVGLDVVLANGSAVHASATENEDLFWALRGAADSFGIITSFYLQTQQAPELVTYFSFAWPTGMFDSKATFVNTWLHLQDFAQNASVVDDRISFGNYADGTVFNIGGLFFGTVEEFQRKIQPEFLRTLPTPATIDVSAKSWIKYLELVSDKNSISVPLSGYDDHDNFFAKSITVPEETGFSRASLEAWYDFAQTTSPTPYFTITNLYGGPGSLINNPASSSAYSERSSLFVQQLYGYDAEDGNASIPFIEGLHAAITQAAPETQFGAYLNYVDPSLSAEEARRLYYGEEVYARLEALKEVWDPEAVFWNPQAVGV